MDAVFVYARRISFHGTWTFIDSSTIKVTGGLLGDVGR